MSKSQKELLAEASELISKRKPLNPAAISHYVHELVSCGWSRSAEELVKKAEARQEDRVKHLRAEAEKVTKGDKTLKPTMEEASEEWNRSTEE